MNSNNNQWRHLPIKVLFTDRISGAWGEEPENDDDGIVCIRAADFITDEMRHKKNDLTRRKYNTREVATRKLKIGDLIIEKSGGGDNQPVGRIISFDLDEPALCSNFLERLRPNDQILYSRFGVYLLYSLWANRNTIPFIKQTTGIQNLDSEEYLSQLTYLPSLATQRAIAAYLDHETAKIDAMIDAKQRLLALLAEKRRALITHAVTRGLDPAAPMRDSGVPWIGEVPKHWEVTNLKYVAQIGNGSTPRRDYMPYWQDGNFPWLTSTVVNQDIIEEPTDFVTGFALRECHLPIVEPNSVLVAITGEGKTRGKAAVLPYRATINQHMAYISPQTHLLHHEFLQRYLAGSYEILRIISEGTGSTKGALTCEQVGDFPISLPPISEQLTIVIQLKTTVQRLDTLDTINQHAIELLNERRAALIAAAVTGNIHITE